MEAEKIISMETEKIIPFIKGFGPCQTFFLEGYCYWFALILIIRFGGGTLMYDEVANHFTARINGELYDVRGKVSELYPDAIEWSIFRKADPKHAERIVADCIMKEKH